MTKPRVLVIDDEPLVRATLRDMLEQAGCAVIEAGDGEEGLGLFEREHPVLILTDILMPNKEGIQTISEIRQHGKDVKIVAMSGGGSTKNMTFLKCATKFGADVTLAKPVHFEDLWEIVGEVTADRPRIAELNDATNWDQQIDA